MLRRNYKSLFLFILFSIFISSLQAQHNATARLTIQSGGSVPFIFNTLQKYQDGIKYTNWTTIHVYYTDTLLSDGSPTGSGWKLTFKANSANIEGDIYNLGLDVLELTASGGSSTPPITYNGPLILTNIDQDLVTADVQSSSAGYKENVLISYSCGKNESGSGSSVWNKNADYYVVDIIFTLSAQ